LTVNSLERNGVNGTSTFINGFDRESGFDNFIHLRYKKNDDGKFSDEIAVTNNSSYPAEARWTALRLSEFDPKVKQKLFPLVKELRKAPLKKLAKATQVPLSKFTDFKLNK
jgi:hypothetical protein